MKEYQFNSLFSYRPQKNVQFLLVTGPSLPHIQNLKYGLMSLYTDIYEF